MGAWCPDLPYNALPPLPPSNEVESKKVLKACIRARASLARIKEVSNLLPNPSILINIIPILEAQASSKIENIVTTADKLFLYAEHEANADPITKEALRYRSALYAGYNLIQLKPITVDVMVQICRIVKGIEETCDWTLYQVTEIHKLIKETTALVRKNTPQMYSRELVEAIFTQPYCRISNLLSLGIGHRQTASNYLKKLCEMEILNEIKVGREKIFINTRLMHLLTKPVKSKDN